MVEAESEKIDIEIKDFEKATKRREREREN